MADDPIAFWNGPGAARWVTQQARFDRAFAAHGELAMAQAGLATRTRVLDVGCGCGGTTLSLGARVAPGTVLGVDVSAPMLGRAKERAAGIANVSFVNADATTHAFEPGSFDVVFSRFGVMFFTDPVRAFGNLRASMAPGARLSCVVWRTQRENPWMDEAARDLGDLVQIPPQASADEPGPFSFGDPDRVRRILGDAGFRDVELTPHDPMAVLSEGSDREDALQTTMAIGLVGRALQEADEATRERAKEPLLRWVERHVGPDGIRVPTAVWVLTARGN